MSCRRHTTSISYPENFEKLFRKIIETVELPPIGSDDMFALELAVGEAVSNALIHGNKKSPEKKVKIDYEYSDGVFEITITDQGDGFEADNIPDPLLESNLTKDHGRGIMLMQYYMDEVCYNKKGNQISMRKRIKPLK